MSKTLVIVESPTKAEKIQHFLNKDEYIVVACKGHIADLAKGGKHGLGVDIERNFTPKYMLLDDKLEIVDNLLRLSKQCNNILLGTDSDIEGESISWHLSQRLADTNLPIKRFTFIEIKKAAILKAIQNTREIDLNLFHAQEARRILDRLVGFIASPFLMNFYGSNPPLSAGRVQSVVTRMIADREKEIEVFIPENFWTIQVKLSDGKDIFITKYINRLTDQSSADSAKKALSVNDYVVSEVTAAPESKYPPPPLVTSTLQRIMSKQYSLSADKTMKVAQSLYENGYITYIRTDSVRVGDEPLAELREWIKSNNYALPNKPYNYKNKEAAQDAHECIRPVDLTLVPGSQYAIIDKDEKLVYEIIWKYFVASQMMPAVYDTLTVVAHPIESSKDKVKASGKALKSKGFLEILNNSVDVEDGINIPFLKVGQKIFLDKDKNAVKMEKKQTQPPPRFSEDKLIKELDNKNIGRPSTYAELLTRITSRNYVEKKGNVFHATDLGRKITDELLQFFSFMDYNYTGHLEKYLDKISQGKLDHKSVIREFYENFSKEINKAYHSHSQGNEQICDKCACIMLKSNGQFGDYYKCGNAACRNKKPINGKNEH